MNEVQQQTRASDAHHPRYRTEAFELQQPIDRGQETDPDVRSLAERYGLHPLVAAAMLALDYMLFTTLEAPSMELLAVLSAFVGFAAVLPCALVQKYAYGDNTGAAWGKAMLVGLLTAVPTPLPSFLTAAWGVAGFIGMKARAARDSNTIDMQN